MVELFVICEFFVVLGFKIDVDLEKKFWDGVEGVMKKIEEFDKVQVKVGKLVVMMVVVFVGVMVFVVVCMVDFVQKLENLYFVVCWINFVVSSLKVVVNVVQDVGVFVDQVQSSIENVVRFMCNNLFGESYIGLLGVQMCDVNGQLCDIVDIVNDIGKVMVKKLVWFGVQYVQQFGIDENYMLGMCDEVYQQLYDWVKGDYIKSGVDMVNNGGYSLMSVLCYMQSGLEGMFGIVGIFGIEIGVVFGGGLFMYMGV